MTNSEGCTAPTAATRHSDLGTLCGVLAGQVGVALSGAIAARGAASLVVSGGRSPVMLFERLARQPLDWACVTIALADERWVSAADPGSNERLVRDVLLRDNAAAARFTGLKNDAPTPELGAARAWQTFDGVPRPFDCVLLGMGDDGHTASLFPGSPNLAAALDEATAPGCIGMRSPTEPRPRLSLNLAALLDSRRIVILITGGSKWLTYSKAISSGPAELMPVRAVLRQRRVPVDVMWAP